MNVLLVDDDKNMGRGVKDLLELNGFQTDWATDGCEALDLIKAHQQHTYDVILLDWMLPELSGIELCRIIRNPAKGNFQGGVIFLTAKSGLDDCVAALDCGADDYITKPFEIKELIARINAVSRRKAKPYVDEVYSYKNFSINCSQNTLLIDEEPVIFSKTEFKIFKILFINHHQTILRETLFEKVWADNLEISNASLDSYIYNIRKKIKPYSPKIELRLVKGIGYTLDLQ